jgi:hypothetical protein
MNSVQIPNLLLLLYFPRYATHKTILLLLLNCCLIPIIFLCFKFSFLLSDY